MLWAFNLSAHNTSRRFLDKKIKSYPLFALLLFFTACSSPSATQDLSATTTLDFSNNLIIKPIDEYDLSEYSADLYNKLYAAEVFRCTTEYGTPFVFSDNTVKLGSRDYGFWNPEYVKDNGYLIFTLGVPEDTKEPDEVTSQNINKCLESDQTLINLSEELKKVGEATSIVKQLRSEAYGAASLNPQWKQAHQKWHTCLSEQGLTPRTGDEDWGTEQEIQVDTSSDTGKQEAVRIALTEANCSQETGLAQTLADLEASYQAPLIKENQAALNETKIAIQQFTQDIEQRYQATQ